MTDPREDSGGAPVSREAFADFMDALGPFEPTPQVAVACSGGADSMALALLAHDWAVAAGGRATALTVDHRLRPDSTAEARTVANWLRARGMAHEILTRPDRPVKGNLQAAARAARYEMLSAWCASNRILHLLLAHHCEDQAETVLLRLSRGSGVDGIAAMAPITEQPAVRVLRPLLGISRTDLVATLRAADQAYVADPSNADDAFARVRLRRASSLLAAEGLTVDRLCETAARAGRARVALERATAVLLARAVDLRPEGYGCVDLSPLRDAPEEIGLRALAATIACVGGRVYAPRLERLERLYDNLRSADGFRSGRTLGGCRIVPWRRRALICREPRAAGEVGRASGSFVWDGRFRIRMGRKPGFEVRRLGRKGWADAVAECPVLRKSPIPAAVRPSLPA
ncbi:MAG: tRNA lysidine(34) synthetase TilS, partial [Alphaproteobacteria bacterium]|nr:tRNA lysidine(34) synthetase TilS [Alphaproteobacteria bacterium]